MSIDGFVTKWLDTSGIKGGDREDVMGVYDRVYKLYTNIPKNRESTNFFFGRDAINYSEAFKPASNIFQGQDEYHLNNTWADIYIKTMQNAGLTEHERVFMYCLKYMMLVEFIYAQFVNKICYLLVWQPNTPREIVGYHKWKRVESVNEIQQCRLNDKLKFLHNNGFEDLADVCDVDLRNSLAHMMVVIGEPTIRQIYHASSKHFSSEREFSIEGTSIRIKRRGKNEWVDVDIRKAENQLDGVCRLYQNVFSLCSTVHDVTTHPMFKGAMDNPDRVKITREGDRISFSYNRSPEK